MQDFINGFLKAWKAWSDDGKDTFLESFLDEVKNSKNDPTNFLGILEQEIKSLSQEGLKDDISFMLEVIESMKNEISHTKDNIKRAEEISITENENELAKQELEKYALEAENKSLKQYNESQNPNTLYEQQVAQGQSKEEELSNKQDLELETLRDNNIKKGLDDESLGLLESLQILRNETNEVANYLRANEIDYSRPTGENTTSKIASLALEENNQLNEKETDTQEQAKHTEKSKKSPRLPLTMT